MDQRGRERGVEAADEDNEGDTLEMDLSIGYLTL